MAQRQRCLVRGEQDCCQSWSPFASQSTNRRSLYTTVKSTTCVIVPWNVMWQMCPNFHQIRILDGLWKIRFVSIIVSFKRRRLSNTAASLFCQIYAFATHRQNDKHYCRFFSIYKTKSRNKGSVFMPICSRVIISRVTVGAKPTFWRLKCAHDRDRWDKEQQFIWDRTKAIFLYWQHCNTCWEDLPPFYVVIFPVFSVVIILWHI